MLSSSQAVANWSSAMEKFCIGRLQWYRPLRENDVRGLKNTDSIAATQNPFLESEVHKKQELIWLAFHIRCITHERSIV